MKKTDLEKNKALKLVERMKKSGTPGRFSTESGAGLVDRREQRRLDQAKGLVSFPVKLRQETIAAIRKLSQEQDTDINDLVDSLLSTALTSKE